MLSALDGTLSNHNILEYEAELFLAYDAGHGLPCSLWDLPCDMAQMVLLIQQEVEATRLDQRPEEVPAPG